MKKKYYIVIIFIAIGFICLGLYFQYNNKNTSTNKKTQKNKDETLYYQGNVSPSGEDKPVGTG